MLVLFYVVVILGINDSKLISLSEISNKGLDSTLTKYLLNFSAIIFVSFISVLSIIIFLGKVLYVHFFYFNDDFFYYFPCISYTNLIYF